MYNDLLPIGSIVRLKGGERLLMIFGILQRSPIDPAQTFDYIGVSYPEGHVDARLHIGFNKDLIEEVVFRGYEDEARTSYLKTLEIISEVTELHNQGTLTSNSMEE